MNSGRTRPRSPRPLGAGVSVASADPSTLLDSIARLVGVSPVAGAAGIAEKDHIDHIATLNIGFRRFSVLGLWEKPFGTQHSKTKIQS